MDLKEAVAKIDTQTWCEPLFGLEGRTRCLRQPKPDDILSGTRLGIGGEWAMTTLLILPGEPSVPWPL
jgi:hypothetical protein